MTPTTRVVPKRNGYLRRRRRVCLFGTSANPPTGDTGHRGIASYLSGLSDDSGERRSEEGGVRAAQPPLFDEVRVLPVYRHMFTVSDPTRASSDLVHLRINEFD